MAKNITLLGASYSDVPAVLLPRTEGGTAEFVDISDDTVTAADVRLGVVFHLPNGQQATGTMNEGERVYYGTCDTDNTQAKAVSISGISELYAGLSIRVKFTYAQSYNGNPQLNLNQLGAKNINRYGTTAAVYLEWQAGEVIDFIYDGTNWIIVNGAMTWANAFPVGTIISTTSSNAPAFPGTWSEVVIPLTFGDTKNGNRSYSAGTGTGTMHFWRRTA